MLLTIYLLDRHSMSSCMNYVLGWKGLIPGFDGSFEKHDVSKMYETM